MPLLENLTWVDVQDYLQQDDRLIMVTGSTEQHGRHLIFGTDALVPYTIAQRVSEETGVLLAPPLNYGMSLYHMGFPGTMSLWPATLTRVLEELLRSAYIHGFGRIFVVNGHGGNIACWRNAVIGVTHESEGLEVKLRNWWQDPIVSEMLEVVFPGHKEVHATIGETAAVLAIRPEAVRLDRAKHTLVTKELEFVSARQFVEEFPHGVIGGDPRLATVEMGREILEKVIEKYSRELERWSGEARE